MCKSRSGSPHRLSRQLRERKMTSLVLVVLASACARVAAACYWNADCPFLLHSTKTPYDTIRGDIRDYAIPQNCKAVSIWTLNRHGNRNPGRYVTPILKYIVSLKGEIIASHETGRSQLCAQDIQNFRRWSWNETLEVSQSFLTGTGYEELFDIASRLREKYPHLLRGSESDYYFRPTNEQRTITSAIAFVHGLTEGTNLSLTHDRERLTDDVIWPTQNCDRYHKTVMAGQLLHDQIEAYYKSAEFIAVKIAVQQRLGISTLLSGDDIYAFYELCRFDRSWTEAHQSPWCAAFSDHDLEVLEFRDDIRHYFRNGYGSSISEKLGRPPLKDLYESFEAATAGQGKKFVSYITHGTTIELVYSAMGVFKGAELQGSYRDPNRLWRTSFIATFSVNIIAVLNSCEDSGSQSYRVQLFINEKETELCPLEGCTWQQFQDKFAGFKSADLDFCSMEYSFPEPEPTVTTVTGPLS